MSEQTRGWIYRGGTALLAVAIVVGILTVDDLDNIVKAASGASSVLGLFMGGLAWKNTSVKKSGNG